MKLLLFVHNFTWLFSAHSSSISYVYISRKAHWTDSSYHLLILVCYDYFRKWSLNHGWCPVTNFGNYNATPAYLFVQPWFEVLNYFAIPNNLSKSNNSTHVWYFFPMMQTETQAFFIVQSCCQLVFNLSNFHGLSVWMNIVIEWLVCNFVSWNCHAWEVSDISSFAQVYIVQPWFELFTIPK